MEEQFAAAQTWFLIYTLLATILIGIFGTVLTLQHPASPWFIENAPDSFAGTTAFWVLGIATVVGLCAALPWIYATFWRHYTYVWRHLKHTGLALIVADGAQWEPVVEQGRRSFWNRVTSLKTPAGMLEQIDLAADYWQYSLVTARNEHHKAEAALRAGNLTRLADNIATHTFNTGCGIVILVLLGLPLAALLPLVITAMHFYLKQSATKAALLDYFRDKPEINRAKLNPLD